ncbi:LysM peptidoglycan-binding domain-containing protein [Herbaspirillum sp. LeCh32-8]|uniref:FimV/HubP family polar landmark protein n=1 Tax=Herbaspirillum sp. LeCh32-8 TaxID=2821356 RepID=UPI001AE8221E|nr:FimV/HubP family polar landmark protein [Herbaspirillum sp. LeCh32-8]MBP0599313.1 LysM peptidoglycan-binding domain-containing protein [Herbaspirillum sp. LeCh32-8]
MPLNTNKKLPSSQITQIKKLSAALAIALAIPLGAQAASLGRLTVLSSLGQPLRAEIEVTSVSADEAGKLSAKLASAEAFSRANVDYNPVLGSLSFAVEQRQGRHFIRISSSQPVSDPFVDLLLELSAGNSKLVREYTFLLDPADSKAPRNAQVAPLTPSAPTVKSEPAPANNAPPAAVPTPAAPAPAPAQEAAAPAQAPAPASAPTPAPVAAAPAPAAAPAAPSAAPAATAAAPAAAPSASIPVSGEEPATSIVQRSAPSALAEELIRRQQATPDNTPASASPGAAPAAAAGQSASGEVVRPAAATAPAAAAAAGDKAADYRVKQGDTLAGIAARNKQANVSLDQMLIALYRANPDAFMGKNINRLRSGSTLAIPDQPTAAAIDQSEARGMVVAQAQDFNAYRNKLASQVANSSARRPGSEGQSGGGKITTRVEERSGSASARDRLELSRASRAKGNTGNAGAAEDKAASERALSEANDRVKELEKNVGDLQKLLEMKNKTIADLSTQQKEAEAAKAAPAAAPEAAKPEEKPAAAGEAKPEDKPVEAAPAPAPAAPAPAPSAPAPAAPVAVAAKPAEKPQSFFESVTQNPYVLAGVGAVVALLVAGAGVVAVRRSKKKAEEPAAEASAEPEPAPEPEAPAAAAAAVAEPASEEPPADEAAVEAAPLAVAAAEEAPAEEAQVDPIAEADMYIAYGRHEQAEDILKLALQSTPERQALHSKLLEIYAKRGDVSNFNKVAADLHQLSGGLNEAWAKAADMGFELDPTNPLYGGAPPAPPVAEPEPEEQGMEFDLSDFKGAEIQPGETAAAATPPVDLGKDIDFDLDLENGAKPADDEPILPAATAATSASALLDSGDDEPAMSLSDLDLSLPDEAAPTSASNILEEDEESAFEAEMTTKLDLAAAYQEIGDKEGAKELLEEVMRGGNDVQVARAKDMLAALA